MAYEAWIKDRQADLKAPDMAPHKKAGEAAVENCRAALSRIEAGLNLLTQDEQAAEAFRFANLAMWQQRIHTILSLKKSVLYLDQFAVSETMKSINPETKANQAGRADAVLQVVQHRPPQAHRFRRPPRPSGPSADRPDHAAEG